MLLSTKGTFAHISLRSARNLQFYKIIDWLLPGKENFVFFDQRFGSSINFYIQLDIFNFSDSWLKNCISSRLIILYVKLKQTLKNLFETLTEFQEQNK